MLDSLLRFLNFLPGGLLIAAALLEGFVLKRRDRDSEPAVLWLLFCAAAAGAVAAVTGVVLHVTGVVPGASAGAVLSVVLAAVASGAWIFKRLARNRSFLLLRERFYSATEPGQPARRKSGQAFLIGGYRGLLGLAVMTALGGALLMGAPAGRWEEAWAKWSAGWNSGRAAAASSPAASKDVKGAEPGPSGAGSAAAPPTPVPAAAEESTLSPEIASQDPTRTEIPSEEASSMAAMATSAAALSSIPPPEKVRAGEENPAASGSGSETTGSMGGAPPVPVVAVPPARPVSRNSQYFSKVRPILSKHCVSCHGPLKQKGDLRLDSPDAIRAGVNGKPVIIPGAADKSRLYHVTGLPADDTDRMPPKGNPLSSSERKVLADWIIQGADLGDGVSIPLGQGGVFMVDTLARNLQPPDPGIIESLKKDHVVVRELSKNGYVLELDFSHSDRARGSLQLAQLAPIALNIHTLDFSRTSIQDSDLAQLAPMTNLHRLLLSRTAITDAGLAMLRANINLEHLNLYNTAVTDAGLNALGSLKALKKVYLWQSKATEEGARKLRGEVPGVEVSLGS